MTDQPQNPMSTPDARDNYRDTSAAAAEERREAQEAVTNFDVHTPSEAVYTTRLRQRNRTGTIAQGFYFASLVIAVVALIALMLNIINEAFGSVIVQYEVDPATLVEPNPDGTVPALDTLNAEQLASIIVANTGNRVRIIIAEALTDLEAAQFAQLPLREALPTATLAPELETITINEADDAQRARILADNVSVGQLLQIVQTEIVGEEVLESFPLWRTLTQRAELEAIQREEYPQGELINYSWVNREFLSVPGSSVPAQSGIRVALFGSLWMLAITILVAVPLGIGAAIYLEEYATDTWYNRLIETNIRNLGGVPSIIYGILGLAIFVRALQPFTSGDWLPGPDNGTGRTIISAAFTLALLILPVIIINAQEAIRGVSSAIREGSYGLGATKWQTISRQVLPAAIPGILTGTILAISRAIGETAPLIVVGASTAISADPNGPFSRFTALPIQIFQWTDRPQDQFRDIAAAGILVLLVVLLSMNTIAIVLRNRYSRNLGT